MKKLILFLFLCFNSITYAQDSNIEFDHFFIFTDNYLVQDSFFKELGFYTKIYHHTGNGTANTIIYFENFYLEFLSIDDLEAFEKNNSLHSIKWKQNKVLNTNKTSPFGVGLHLKDDKQSAGFETFGYHQAWLREGETIEIANSTNKKFSEPFIFIVPDYLKWDYYGGNQRKKNYYKPKFKNSYGLIKLSKIELYTSSKSCYSKTYKQVMKMDVLNVVRAKEDYVKIIFDNKKQNKIKDFRPKLPLVFEY